MALLLSSRTINPMSYAKEINKKEKEKEKVNMF